MWFLRRMLRESWTEKNNEEIVRKANTKMYTIRERRAEYEGHVMRQRTLSDN